MNRLKHECEAVCLPEGKYRYLEPETLEDWEVPPDLPSYREMVDMPGTQVRAMLWLRAHYTSR